MIIHYLSDIHLELYDITKIPRILQLIIPQSNICVLAGDIGYPFEQTYISFLRGIHSKFEHIFLIHGNHEYYQFGNNQGKSNEEIIQQTHDIISYYHLDKIHFLHNSHYDLGKYRFIGSVLWSHIEDERYLSNDYDVVYKNSIEEMNQTHFLCKDYIQQALIQAQTDEKEVIMITHHLPSYRLNHPKYARYYQYHQCFSSHSDEFITHPVKLWIFGHTHSTIHMNINNILCISNPIGYKGERVDVNFNCFVEID
jgi:predicted phosphodiesterase